jgi:proline iminopeptidase
VHIGSGCSTKGGAGRSTPSASTVENTTQHLVADIESLRVHLNIRRWLVFGGSWGSTLALAYAAKHPEACRRLILRGIWHCRRIDLTWWFDGIRLVYPDYWQAFAEHIPLAERGNLLDAYLRRLLDPDPTVHLLAAIAWETYEMSCAHLLPWDAADKDRGRNVLSMPRIEAYYMRNSAFLRENELIEAVPRFRHVPAVIVHGRYDMSCPVEGAVALAAAWPEATLSIVPDAGHSATEPGVRQNLVAAADRIRTNNPSSPASPRTRLASKFSFSLQEQSHEICTSSARRAGLAAATAADFSVSGGHAATNAPDNPHDA